MLARGDVVMAIVLLALRFVGSGLNAGTTNALHHVTGMIRGEPLHFVSLCLYLTFWSWFGFFLT
jgi:hypothetical protein